MADDVFANSPTISNQQVHAVFISNGSVTTLYLNGVAQTGTVNTGLRITGTNGLAASDNASHTSYTDSLDGTILGFASYARALTPAEVTARFNALVPNLGSVMIDRSFNDGADGQLYLYDLPIGTVGRAQNFEFYDNESGSRWITPLIFEQVGNTYYLRGIGTSRLSTGAGVQSYPFGLTAGSNFMGSTYTFGFIDRRYWGPGVGFQTYSGGGSVDWDYASPTRWRITSASTNFAVEVGTVGGQLHATETRTYSARLTLNSAPTSLTLSGNSIPENPFTGGYPVGTLGDTDPEGDPLTYSLVSGYGDNATFSISGTSLLLNVNGATDFETKSSYSLLIRGSDPTGNTVEQYFTVFVRNGNEAPSFTKGANQTHAFNTTGTQTIANWATAINDGDSTVTQALTFNVSLVSNTGINFAALPSISANGTLTYSLVQSQGTATFNVSLTDDNTLEGAALTSATQSFTITVSAPAPEIDVTSSGDFTSIADGDTTPSAAKKTHFGQVATSLSRQFAIRNTGLSTLSVSSITVTGDQASEFVVTDAPTSIGAGSLLYFTLTYTPSSGVATSRAKITVNSNDADEAAYDFLVEGEKAPGLYNSTWTARTAAAASAWYSVTYGNGQFVAVANSGATQVMTSPDGSNWTARTIQAASGWYSVTYGNGQFVAVAQTGTNQVMNSPDGINWIARTTPESNRWRSVTYGNGLFVAVAENGTNQIMTSPDGAAWTARAAAQPNVWLSVTYGNGRFVAVAYNGANRVMTSPDGVTWTAAPTTLNASSWRAVTYGNGRFVAVADSGTQRAATSLDGLTWTAQSSPPASSWVAVTYGNGLFVATAESGTNRVMTSADGVTWTAGNAIAATIWYSVAYGKDRFVSLSIDGTDRVMVSGYPEVAVTGNSTAIVDGAATASATNHTHFGQQSSALARTFTITNTGAIPLTISSITSTGPDASRFVVSGAPASVPVGSSATFTVTFTPIPGAISRATITVNNNDPDEAAYDFAVEGSFTPPTVTSVLPSEGTTAGGTALTITGTGFGGDTTVTIGGVPVTGLNIYSPTLLTCIAPAGAAGAKSVVVTTAVGANPANTHYTHVVATPGGLQSLNANLSGIGGSSISASVVQTDGKIILAGSFNSIHGSPRDGIARLNADGTLDSTFNLNLGSSTAVWALALQPDGKLLLGGVFDQAAGASRQNLARVNPDGTVDSFVGNANGRIYALCVQPDGKILIGGTFTQVLGGTRNYIARLNSDGSLDPTFSPSLNGTVRTIGLDSSGRVLVGGDFTEVQSTGSSSSTSYRHLVRLSSSGVLDTSFWPNPSNRVYSLLVQPDGKIAVGGDFSSFQPNGAASPTNRASLARLNPDGTLDPSLVSTGFSGVTSLALQADGKLIATALNYGLTPVRRWDASGGLDASFTPAANQYAQSVVIEPNGRVLIGGIFTTLNSSTRNLFARLNNDLATNTLSAPNLTQVVWFRGGSAPELSQVTIEQSLNGGASWSSLGTPARVAGTANWQVTGLNLPNGVQLRARGRTSGGYYNSSSYVVEQVASFSNAPPADITLSATSLAENNAANATVGTLTTTDANTGDLFTYTLVGGAGSTDNASFTLSGASLRLTPVADFETKSSYALRVRSTDAGGQFIEKAFTVTITNANETPSFTKGADITVPHSTTTAQTVSGWATAINDGDSTVTQALTFNVTVTGGANLFTVAPAVSGAGVLTFRPNGTAGIATVQVTLTDDTTVGGTAALTTAAQTFTITVQAPPLVPFLGSILPTSGTSAGGTTVTITGNNFSAVNSVSFGGAAAASFTVNSDTSITAVTPAGMPGVATVAVTTSGGTSAINPLFTYFAPTTTTLTSSQNPSLSLAGPTFTARAVSAHPGLAGQMALFIDNVLFETKAVDASGFATFTPPTSALGTGTRSIRAVYNADGAAATHGTSSATLSQTVQRSSLPITLTGLAQTYDGTPRPVGATVSIPSGYTATVTFTYAGSASAPTNAGSYPVVATLDHPQFFGSATGTLVVAPAFVGIAFVDTLQAYDGTPRVAGVVTFPPGIPATLTYQTLVNGSTSGTVSTTAPLPAGRYRLTAATPDPNYVLPTTAGELYVTKRGVTLRFGETFFIADGQPKPVAITTVPAGVGVTVTYRSGATTLTTAPSAPPPGGGVWTVDAVVTDQESNIGSGQTTLDILTKQPAALTLTGPATANPYEKGPYVAQLAPVRPGLRPTGTVIFRHGTTEIGRSTPDAQGKCTLIDYALSIRPTPYSIVAEYTGDAYQLSNVSAPVQTTMSKKIIDLGFRPDTLTYNGQAYDWSNRNRSFDGAAIDQALITYNGSTTPPKNATASRTSIQIVAPLLKPDVEVRETIALQINPQPVLIYFENLRQTTNSASGYSPAVVTSPGIPASSYSLSFNGLAQSQVGAPGTYAVRAVITDPNYQYAEANGTFVLKQEPVSITISDLSHFYNGEVKRVRVSTTPPASVIIKYNGDENPPRISGEYRVTVAPVNPELGEGTSATMVIDNKAWFRAEEETTGAPGQGKFVIDGQEANSPLAFNAYTFGNIRYQEDDNLLRREVFTQWKDGEKERSRTIPRSGGVPTLVANFQYRYYLHPESSGPGSVPNKDVVGNRFKEGDIVILKAQPNPGYLVDRWEYAGQTLADSQLGPNGLTATITIQRNHHYPKAYFVPGLTVEGKLDYTNESNNAKRQPDGTVLLKRIDRMNWPEVSSTVDPANGWSQSAKLLVPNPSFFFLAKAVPAPGYTFVRWKNLEGATEQGPDPSGFTKFAIGFGASTPKITAEFASTGADVRVSLVPTVRRLPRLALAAVSGLRLKNFGAGAASGVSFDIVATGYRIRTVSSGGTTFFKYHYPNPANPAQQAQNSASPLLPATISALISNGPQPLRNVAAGNLAAGAEITVNTFSLDWPVQPAGEITEVLLTVIAKFGGQTSQPYDFWVSSQ